MLLIFRFSTPEQGPRRVLRSAKTRHTKAFGIRKPRSLHQTDLVPYRDRAADSLRPGLKTPLQTGRQRIFQNNVRKLNFPAWFQDAIGLLKKGLLVRGKVDDPV